MSRSWCEGLGPPEAASPAAHEGARHRPLVTRSLVTEQVPMMMMTRILRTEMMDTDWRLAHAWPAYPGLRICWWGWSAELWLWPHAPCQPHSASDCIICKSHIFIPPPPPRPLWSAECLDQARGNIFYQINWRWRQRKCLTHDRIEICTHLQLHQEHLVLTQEEWSLSFVIVSNS